jgi:hypothetical protein
VIWRDGVVMSTGGEVAPGRRKEEDDTSWTNVNLTRPKSEKKSMWLIQLLQIDVEDLKQ